MWKDSTIIVNLLLIQSPKHVTATSSGIRGNVCSQTTRCKVFAACFNLNQCSIKSPGEMKRRFEESEGKVFNLYSYEELVVAVVETKNGASDALFCM